MARHIKGRRGQWHPGRERRGGGGGEVQGRRVHWVDWRWGPEHGETLGSGMTMMLQVIASAGNVSANKAWEGVVEGDGLMP